MIRFSVILSVVAVAVGLLVAGAVSATLTLVYLAIGVASVALLLLIAGVVIWGDAVFGVAAGQGAAGQAGEAVVTAPAREQVPVAVAAGAGSAAEAPVAAGPVVAEPVAARPVEAPAAEAAPTGAGRPGAGRPVAGRPVKEPAVAVPPVAAAASGLRSPDQPEVRTDELGADPRQRFERETIRARRAGQVPAKPEPAGRPKTAAGTDSPVRVTPSAGRPQHDPAVARPDDDAVRRRGAAAASVASPETVVSGADSKRPDATRPFGQPTAQPAAPVRSAAGTPPVATPDRGPSTRENTRVAPLPAAKAPAGSAEAGASADSAGVGVGAGLGSPAVPDPARTGSSTPSGQAPAASPSSPAVAASSTAGASPPGSAPAGTSAAAAPAGTSATAAAASPPGPAVSTSPATAASASPAPAASSAPSASSVRPVSDTSAAPSVATGPAAASPASPATPAASAPAGPKVTVVPGIARYHKPDCILIRFLGAEDLETMSVGKAEETGCVPCRACRPEKELASA